MATLAVQSSVVTGVAVTFNTAAGGGDSLTNDEPVALMLNLANFHLPYHKVILFIL